MDKKLLLLIVCLSLNIAARTQSEKDFLVLKENYSKLLQCFYLKGDNGVGLGWDDMLKLKTGAMKNIGDKDSNVRANYPIFMNLVQFVDFATKDSPMPSHACNELKLALAELDRINRQNKNYREGKLRDYERLLGINLNTIEEFYESEYCHEYHITKEADCAGILSWYEEELLEQERKMIKKQSETQDTVPGIVTEKSALIIPRKEAKPAPKTYKGSSGGQFDVSPDDAFYSSAESRYRADDAVKLLRKLLQNSILKTDFFELKELLQNDYRRVPGVTGTQYEVIFKNRENLEILFFEPSWYIVPDRTMERQDNHFWDEYYTSVGDFKTLILSILEDYGGGSFEVFVQGSADSPIFQEKSLLPAYDTKFFQQIDALRWNELSQQLEKVIVNIGPTYDNEDLPDLRAAFIKWALMHMDGFNHLNSKIHILKGRVKAYPDAAQRNCNMVLIVDWDKAELYARKMQSEMFVDPKTKK
jgi:hypothetical protein